MMERGAYRDLLDAYYQAKGKLRSDNAGLYRLCGAVMPDEQAAVRQVVHEFFQDGELGYLRNPRADKEIAEQEAFFAKQAENGRKGAEVRWHGGANGDPNGDAIATPMATPMPRQWPNDGQSQSHKQKTKADGARASRLPPDWRLTTEQIEWAIGAQPTWDAEHVLKVGEAFRDHWTAIPGSRGLKLDWGATWRNWVRREGPAKVKAAARDQFAGGV